MKRAMTTKKALTITAELHRWLADKPKALPTDWPGWEKYGIDVSVSSKDRHPLCEVAAGKCLDCPLIALWIEGSGVLPATERLKSCLVSTSPWMIRRNLRHSAHKEDRVKVVEAAEVIYLEAERALESGVRAPDLSIYQPKREKRGGRVHKGGRVPRNRTSGRVRREA